MLKQCVITHQKFMIVLTKMDLFLDVVKARDFMSSWD